jgi:hypothetical protein
MNPPGGSLDDSFLSLPLFLLTWLPHLGLCQWVEGNLSCRTPSRWRISSLNPPSSAALLNQSPDDVYTPYVCNSSEVPLLRHYVIAPVLLHWCRGAVALWRRDITVLWRHARAVLVFIDCTTTRPWGQLCLSSSTTFMRERSRALGLQGYEYSRYSITIQLRRQIMASGSRNFFCFLIWIPTHTSLSPRAGTPSDPHLHMSPQTLLSPE